MPGFSYFRYSLAFGTNPTHSAVDMTDVLTRTQRSFCMSRIRGSETSPERSLRQHLWSMGVRYRLKSKLPGRPDIVISGAKIAVFVDGCFWHRCPVHGVLPKSNATFWREKLQANRERDKRVTAELRALGWRVFRVWEHDVAKVPERIARRIAKEVSRRSRGTKTPSRQTIIASQNGGN